MATLQDLRQQYPQYDDMSDGQLADALYSRHYSDMDRADFDQRLGVSPQMGRGSAALEGVADAFGGSYNDEAQGLVAAAQADPRPRGLDRFRDDQGNVFTDALGVAGDVLTAGSPMARAGFQMATGQLTPEQQQAYEGARDERREALAQAQEQHPVSTLGGQLGGVALQALLTRGAGASATAPSYARAGLEGAGYGALYASGSEDGDLMDRVRSGVGGALIGGPLGVAGLAVANAAAPIARRVFSRAGSQAAPRVAATRTVQTPLERAADRESVRLTRAAATENPLVRNTSQALSDIPVIGRPLRAGAQQSLDDLGQAVSRTRSSLGGGVANEAGEQARSGIVQYAMRSRSVLGGRVDDAYKRVLQNVDDTVRTPLTATRRAAARIMRERQSQGINDVGRAVRQISDQLQSDGLNYSGLKGLRTRIGQMLDDPMRLSAGDVDANELRLIYGALSDDLASSVRRAATSPRALELFNRANRYAGLVADERKALQTIIGGRGQFSGEQIIGKIARLAGTTSTADIRKLNRLRRAVSPETWDEIGASILAGMGENAKTGLFSGSRFATEWMRLSDAAKRVLFPRAATRQSLENIYEISLRFDELAKMSNHSNTATVGSVVAAFASGAIAPVQTIMALVPMAVFSRMMARPAQARKVVLWAQAYTNYVAQPSQATARVLAQRAGPLAGLIAGQVNDVSAQDVLMVLRNPQVLADQENAEQEQNPDAQPVQPQNGEQ